LDIDKLYELGRALSKTKDFVYHFTKLLKYVAKGCYRLINDPQFVQIQRDIRQLITDITLGADERFILTRGSLQQLRLILVAVLIERMTVAIPTIHKSTDKYEAKVSNIFLVLKRIVPDQIRFSFNEDITMDTSDLKDIIYRERNELRLQINNINLTLHNLHVWFKTKSFPKIEDSGIMHIDMPDGGLNIDILLEVNWQDHEIFSVRCVNVYIAKLRITLEDTKRNFLNNTMLKLATPTIKKKVEMQVREQILTALDMLNGEVSRQFRQATRMGRSRMEQTVNKVAPVFRPKKKGSVKTGKQVLRDVPMGKKLVVHTTIINDNEY